MPDAVISVRCRTTVRATMRQAMRWSKGHVQLHKRYAPPTEQGAARAWRYTLREVVQLAKRVPAARTREDWLRLGWDLAWLSDQVVGGIVSLAPPVP